MNTSLSTRVVLTPLRAGLRAGQGNSVDVLLRVQAPDAPAGNTAARPPQGVALVLDRSGSMAGQPLVEARRCAEHVATHLCATDFVSLVDFDHRVRRLLPASPLGDGAALRHAVAGIDSGGNTDLHGGWLEGAQSLADLPQLSLRRVILLSDGCANVGITDSEVIAPQCAAQATLGVTTSTYGLGRSFNEDLMVAMARAGGGSHYYGDTAEDLLEPFQQEFDLLAHLCLVKLEVSAVLPEGAELRWLNELQPAGVGWRLPDLAWGAEAWALARIRLPQHALPAVGDRLQLLRVEVRGEGLDGESVQLERVSLALQVMSPAAHDALPRDQLVLRRSVELEVAEMLARMRSAAMDGHWEAVELLLCEAGEASAQHVWVHGMLTEMAEIASRRERQRLMKETLYSTEKLRRRLASRMEKARDAAGDALPAYLRRKPLQGKRDL